MKSWKTSLCGFIAGAGPLVAMYFNDSPLAVKIGGLCGALGILALGLVAKDHNVTGGTRDTYTRP